MLIILLFSLFSLLLLFLLFMTKHTRNIDTFDNTNIEINVELLEDKQTLVPEPVIADSDYFYIDNLKSSDKIPKIIWSFWNDINKIPETVKKCIETWKFHNSNYKIIIITTDTIKYYTKDIINPLTGEQIDILNLKHASDNNFTRLSDFVRVSILMKYGGIWCDASNICTGSFDEFLSKTNTDYVGYYINSFTAPNTNKFTPVPENWFFACSTGCDFIKEWFNEFISTNRFDNMNDYINHVKNNLKINISGIPDHVQNYLGMHVVSQVVLNKKKFDKDNNETVYNEDITFYKAEDAPFKYLCNNNWNAEKAINSLLTDSSLWTVPLIKLRSAERNYMENNKKIRDVIFENYK